MVKFNKNITLIMAKDIQGGIGLNNGLPWSIPSELKHFSDTTKDSVVICGRKTYEHIGKLKNRTMIVMTTDSEFGIKNNVRTAQSIEEVLRLIKDIPENVFVIGGAEIYKMFLPYVSNMIITTIIKEYKYDTNIYKTIPDLEEYLKKNFVLTDLKDSRKVNEPMYFIRYYERI